MNRFLYLIVSMFLGIPCIHSIGLYEVDRAPFGKIGVHAVDWVSKDSVNYVVYGGDDGLENKEIRVSEFITSAAILNLKASAHFSDEDTSHVNSVHGIVIGDKIYIAAGGYTGNTGKEIIIYEFDPVSGKLKNRELVNYEDSEIYTVKWFSKNGAYYLAVGGKETLAGSELRVYYFDPVNEELALLYGAMDNFYHGAVHSIDWIVDNDRIFLVVGGTEIASITRQIRIYEFSVEFGSLSLLATASNGNIVYSVAWYKKNNNLYLATGGNDAAENQEIRIFSFDEANNTLAQVADASFYNGVVKTVTWHEQDGNFYLTAGGDDGIETNEIRIYQFDTMLNSLIPAYFTSFSSGIVDSLSWQQINTAWYLAAGGRSNYYDNIALHIFKSI